MVATQIEKSAENGEVFLQKIRGSEILESECAAFLSGFARLLNDVEMEIYNPRHVAYQVEECVLGKIVEFDSHRATPVENECSRMVSPPCSRYIRFLGRDPTTPERRIKSFEGQRIAVSEKTGKIALAQMLEDRVYLFSESTVFLRTIGHEGTGADLIDVPRSVAFMSSGNIVVVHGENRREQKNRRKLSVFTQRGHHITDLSQHLLNPSCVSVRNDGKLLVCDGCSVKVLSPDGANLTQTIKAPYCDESPCFAIHHQGLFFVCYDSLHCVKVFSDEGQFLYEIGCKGTGDGQLRCPGGLAIDKLNNLVVCDKENNRLQFFSLEGKFVNSVTREILKPESVAVAKNGDLLLCLL